MEISKTVIYKAPPPLLLNNERKKVAIYIRVSTDNEEQENSYLSQLEYYDNFINNNPQYELVGIYGDKGISGLSVKHRESFKKMIEDALNKKIDYIFTKSISRFARNAIECEKYIKILAKNGIIVFFEKEGVNSSERNFDLLIHLLSVLAQEESRSISEATRWTYINNAKYLHITRPTPYGYRKIDLKNHIWEIDKNEAKIVKLIYKYALNDLSYKEIVRRLNRYELKHNSKVKWNISRVRRILLNEVYMGDILTHKYIRLDYINKRLIPNNGELEQIHLIHHHQPIISIETFNRVKEIVKLKGETYGKRTNKRNV